MVVIGSYYTMFITFKLWYPSRIFGINIRNVVAAAAGKTQYGLHSVVSQMSWERIPFKHAGFLFSFFVVCFCKALFLLLLKLGS